MIDSKLITSEICCAQCPSLISSRRRVKTVMSSINSIWIEKAHFSNKLKGGRWQGWAPWASTVHPSWLKTTTRNTKRRTQINKRIHKNFLNVIKIIHRRRKTSKTYLVIEWNRTISHSGGWIDRWTSKPAS